MRVSIIAIRAVLAGNINQLVNAFVFEHTSQGHEFWWDQYMARELTNEGRAALEKMLIVYGAK